MSLSFSEVRERSTKEVRDEVVQTVRLCHEHGVPTAAAAIQFPLGHPMVDCVLTGDG